MLLLADPPPFSWSSSSHEARSYMQLQTEGHCIFWITALALVISLPSFFLRVLQSIPALCRFLVLSLASFDSSFVWEVISALHTSVQKESDWMQCVAICLHYKLDGRYLQTLSSLTEIVWIRVCLLGKKLLLLCNWLEIKGSDVTATTWNQSLNVKKFSAIIGQQTVFSSCKEVVILFLV